MGFTGIVWTSRSTEQLARDLTEGPGPATVGGAGAAWVRVANELAGISIDFDKLVARLGAVWDSQASTAATERLQEFGRWLQAVSLDAAANGQRAEEAAVANAVAVLAMPTVTEAVEAKTAQDMMASLAAYNGAVLTGNFAEFDEAATADQANAAAVMTQYEESVAQLAQPWEQPPPPQVARGNALAAEQSGHGGGAGGGGVGGGGLAPMPLTWMPANGIQSSADPKGLKNAGSSTLGRSAGTGMGSGYAPYGPMGAIGRGEHHDTHEAIQPAAALEGAGEAGVSESWLPDAAHNDSPFMVSSVSWGPESSVFDELVAPEEPVVDGYAEEPGRTLERVDDRWVSPPVIGVDRELSL